jgi:hypothetical protein
MSVGGLLHALASETSKLEHRSFVKDSGSMEGGVLTEAVTRDGPGTDALEPEHQGARHVYQGDGRLDIIGEDEVLFRPPETETFHIQTQDLGRPAKKGAHLGKCIMEVLPHPHVLGTLSRIE